MAFTHAVRGLANYGLVEIDMSSQELFESRGYSIHRCVHSWTVHVLNGAKDSSLASLAVKLVGSHVPEEKAIQPWPT